jgi:tripartite-type tricarboxylate transporter receptor subunit TctC
VTRFTRAINDALRSEDMRAALRKLGSDPLGGSPQEFAAYLAEEAPKWVEVVKAAGIKID